MFGLSAHPATAQRSGTPAGNRVAIELFVRPDSEQCQRASQFLQQLAAQRAGLDVAVHDVIEDQAALARLWNLSRRLGAPQAKLPTFFLCDRMVVGFQDDATTGQQIRDFLVINVYIRPGCRYCAAAKRFLDEMVPRWPALSVQYHDAVNDPQVRRQLEALLRRYNQRLTLFPCIHVADRILVGFDGPDTTGRRIEALFRGTFAEGQGASVTPRGPPLLLGRAAAVAEKFVARGAYMPGYLLSRWMPVPLMAADARSPEDAPPPAAEDAPLPPPEDAPPLPPEDAPLPVEAEPGAPVVVTPDAGTDAIEFELLGRVWRMQVSDFGLPAFTFLVGLVDGFNPCAMWVLIFLLSILVNIKDRRKILLIAGSFVIVSGLAYFAFMAAWLNVFQVIGLQRPVQLALGCLAILIGAVNVKDFFAFHRGLTLSIPEAAKPGIYQRVRRIVTTEYLTVALAGAVTLAVVVNIIELLCTAGLPAMYTEILTLHQLPTWQNYAYLLLYNLAYMLDDSVLLAITVVTLSHRRLQESEGRWLKLVSGTVMLVLGLAMIFVPDWLTWGSPQIG